MTNFTDGRGKHAGKLLALAIGAGLASFASASPADNVKWRSTERYTAQSLSTKIEGFADDTKPVSIVIALKLHNPEVLSDYTKELFQPSSLVYHRYLSKEQALATFAPTRKEAEEVATYLRSHGFTNVKIADNNLLVSADGTVGGARAAFNTTIARAQTRGISGIAAESDVQVPTSLPQVDQVLGLDSTERMRTHSLPADRVRPAYSVTKNGAHAYYPQEFATVYNAGKTPTANQTTVAVVGWGSMTNSQKDLNYFLKDKKLANIPSTIVSLTTSSNDDTGQGEWAMDAQAIAGISGGARKLIFYTTGKDYELDDDGNPESTGNDNASLLKLFNQIVSDNTAKVVNMSFGAPQCRGSVQPKGFADDVFQLGVAQGQTFVASSGDNGAFPCPGLDGKRPKNGAYGDQNHFATEYPSSSPYVVSVGGTTLNTTTDDNYVSEAAWAYGGGGISDVEATPNWQPSSYAHRSTPDVAFDADWSASPIAYFVTASDTSGYNQSGYYVNGGTSLAAPLFTGAWARLETAYGNKLGFAAPAIYKYASSSSEKLPVHDVISGSNGYKATKGWDRATGWGSFDIQAVNTFIQKTPGFITESNNQVSNH